MPAFKVVWQTIYCRQAGCFVTWQFSILQPLAIRLCSGNHSSVRGPPIIAAKLALATHLVAW